MKYTIHIMIAGLLLSGISSITLTMSRRDVQKAQDAAQNKNIKASSAPTSMPTSRPTTSAISGTADTDAVAQGKQIIDGINADLAKTASTPTLVGKRQLIANAANKFFAFITSPYYAVKDKIWGNNASKALEDINNTINTQVKQLDKETMGTLIAQAKELNSRQQLLSSTINAQVINKLNNLSSINTSGMFTYQKSYKQLADDFLNFVSTSTNNKLTAGIVANASRAEIQQLSDQLLSFTKNSNTLLIGITQGIIDGKYTNLNQTSKKILEAIGDQTGLVAPMVDVLYAMGQFAITEDNLRESNPNLPIIFSAFSSGPREGVEENLNLLNTTIKAYIPKPYSKLTKFAIGAATACAVGGIAYVLCNYYAPEKLAAATNAASEQLNNLKAKLPTFEFGKAAEATDTQFSGPTLDATSWTQSIKNTFNSWAGKGASALGYGGKPIPLQTPQNNPFVPSELKMPEGGRTGDDIQLDTTVDQGFENFPGQQQTQTNIPARNADLGTEPWEFLTTSVKK